MARHRPIDPGRDELPSIGAKDARRERASGIADEVLSSELENQRQALFGVGERSRQRPHR